MKKVRLRAKFPAVAMIGVVIALLCVAVPFVPSSRPKNTRTGGRAQRARPIAPGPRYLFVWDNTIPGDDPRTTELVDFVVSEKFSGVFIDASPVGYGFDGAAQDYSSFVARVHDVGATVHAVGGYPWWAVPCDAGLPDQPTCFEEGWNYYAAIAVSGVDFDGIVDDTEPHGVDAMGGAYFWGQPEVAAQAYLDFLHGVRERIGQAELICAIPFWFDSDPRLNLALDDSLVPRPLHWYVARIADVLYVMSYRDYSEGAGGILELSAGELGETRTIVAVETMDLGSDSDIITFCEEGRNYLELSLTTVHSAYSTEPNFAGTAIHYYGSLRQMKR